MGSKISSARAIRPSCGVTRPDEFDELVRGCVDAMLSGKVKDAVWTLDRLQTHDLTGLLAGVVPVSYPTGLGVAESADWADDAARERYGTPQPANRPINHQTRVRLAPYLTVIRSQPNAMPPSGGAPKVNASSGKPNVKHPIRRRR